jgi:hypothetical protein
MAMNRVAQQAEVEANLIAFEADLPSLLAKSKGKYAAYRQCRLVAVFDSFTEADAYCDSQFDDGLFSIQEITAEPLDTRWFKYGSDQGGVRHAHGGSH